GPRVYRRRNAAKLPARPLKRDTGRNRNSIEFMGSSRHKAEFPPLLQSGLHEMSVDDLKAMVVDGFPLSTRRGTLWDNLIQILERLKALKIPCKILVDGSFLTKKIDPDDVDFVIDLPVAISDNPTPAQERFLNQLAGHAFCRME